MENIQTVKNIAEISVDVELKLEKFVKLILEWQQAHNLISSNSLTHIWTRHIADSIQTHLALPNVRRWIDLGSGAGFPGVITAIMLTAKSDSIVHLVESNRKKATFLQTVAREIEIPVQVHCERIEDFVIKWDEAIDGVSARALTSLEHLCGFTEKLVNQGATAVFHKGQKVQEEIDKASEKWNISMRIEKNRIDPSGSLLIIDEITPK